MPERYTCGEVPDPMTQAGRLVADVRRSAGISQRELARRSGVPGPVVNAIERSRRQPSVPTLAKLLRGLDLELRLDAVPSGTTVRPSPPAADERRPPELPRVVSTRAVGVAEQARARRISDALDRVDRFSPAKQGERARGVR
jgi:transcriptional regulator with XRE-family HTH domain